MTQNWSKKIGAQTAVNAEAVLVVLRASPPTLPTIFAKAIRLTKPLNRMTPGERRRVASPAARQKSSKTDEEDSIPEWMPRAQEVISETLLELEAISEPEREGGAPLSGGYVGTLTVAHKADSVADVLRQVRRLGTAMGLASAGNDDETGSAYRERLRQGLAALVVNVLRGDWYVYRCSNCGEFFARDNKHGRRRLNRFCSGNCNSSFHAATRTKEQMSEAKRGQRQARREMSRGEK